MSRKRFAERQLDSAEFFYRQQYDAQQQAPGYHNVSDVLGQALNKHAASQKSASEKEACRRLGWPIGSRCASAIPHQFERSVLRPGDVGTVIGMAPLSSADAAERVLVDFGQGRRISLLASSQIITLEQAAATKQRLQLEQKAAAEKEEAERIAAMRAAQQAAAIREQQKAEGKARIEAHEKEKAEKKARAEAREKDACRRLGWPIGSRCAAARTYGPDDRAWAGVPGHVERYDTGTVIGTDVSITLGVGTGKRLLVDFGSGKKLHLWGQQLLTLEQMAAKKAAEEEKAKRSEAIRNSHDWDGIPLEDFLTTLPRVLSPEALHWVSNNLALFDRQAIEPRILEVLRRVLRPTASMPETLAVDWEKLPLLHHRHELTQLRVEVRKHDRPGDVYGVTMTNTSQYRQVRVPEGAKPGSDVMMDVVPDTHHDAALARLFGGIASQPAVEPSAEDNLAFINHPTSEFVVVCKSGVPVRMEPSGDSKLICIVEHGAVVSGVPLRGWLRLQDGSGHVLIEGGPLYGSFVKKAGGKKKKGPKQTGSGQQPQAEQKGEASVAGVDSPQAATDPCERPSPSSPSSPPPARQSCEPVEKSPVPKSKRKEPQPPVMSLGEQVYYATKSGELKQLRKLLVRVSQEKPKDKRQLRNWSTPDGGLTPLHAACEGRALNQTKRFEAASLLLDAHFSANKANADGVTPLYLAVESGDPRLTTLLLDAGVRAPHLDPTPCPHAMNPRQHRTRSRATCSCCVLSRRFACLCTGRRFADCTRPDVARRGCRKRGRGDRGRAQEAHARASREAHPKGCRCAASTTHTAGSRTDACCRGRGRRRGGRGGRGGRGR